MKQPCPALEPAKILTPACLRARVCFLFRATRRTVLQATTALAMATLSGVPAMAQTAWTGPNSPDWFDPGNWSAGVPNNALNAEIDTVANYLPFIGGPAQALNTFVGLSSHGVLTIQNGGSLADERGIIGHNANSLGGVTVIGNGASWTNSVYLIVGNFGEGSLSVVNGGAVSANDAYVGLGANASGLATITGADAQLTVTGGFVIGNSGFGTVNIDTGGKVVSSGADIGYFAGSLGTVNVTGNGSLWESLGILTVGKSGEAVVNVQDGGQISSEHSFLADEASSTVDAFVGGPGARWTTTGNFLVGVRGEADVVVHGGGVVEATSSVIGFDAGSSGLVVVTDVGSAFSITDGIHVGGDGEGGLVAIAGGVVQSSEGMLASTQASFGGALISGNGSAWLNSGKLVVANSGSAELHVEDGGRLTSVGADIGRFSAGVGSVSVTGAGSTWDNSGDLHVAGEGEGELSIAEGALVKVTGTTFIGTAAGSFGIANIGAALGQAPLSPGKLETQKVAFGQGNGALVFNHTATNYLFAPAIEGAGTIALLSGSTTLSADSSGFTGQAIIDGGATLVVNGRLGGTLHVLAAARLMGSGTVGSTTIAAGGTVAPGNSIGTLNIAGDVTFGAGSVYEVEVDPAGTDADLIHAAGKATLNGGTVKHVGLGGTYKPFATYEILAADGGVSGTFAGVASDFAFLDPMLTYDPGSVFLTLVRNDASFCAIGVTPNQCATGTGVESLGAGSQLYDSVVMLDEATARDAFDQLSGEIHASIGGAMLEDSRFVRDAATARIRTAFQEGPVPTRHDLGKGDATVTAAGAEQPDAWIHAFGAWGKVDSDGNAAALDRNIGGVLIGADATAFENWRLGVLAGYSRSTFDTDARASSGSADSYHLGFYGGRQWGALGLRVGTAYTWHSIETSRSISFPGFADKLSAEYDAATAQAFGELGYKIDRGPIAFEPFANLAYVNVRTDSFEETGGAAALTSSSSDAGVTFTTLGLRASTVFGLGGTKATARGMLGWRHAFGDDAPASTFAFAGGDAFAIAGVPIARDTAAVEAGLDFALSSSATLSISYNGQFGSALSDHSAKANFAVRF